MMIVAMTGIPVTSMSMMKVESGTWIAQREIMLCIPCLSSMRIAHLMGLLKLDMPLENSHMTTWTGYSRRVPRTSIIATVKMQ
jgi:predicted metal-dependent hydrolase